MALAVQTPRHLVSIGLLSHQDNSMEEDINFLLKAALEKVRVKVNPDTCCASAACVFL